MSANYKLVIPFIKKLEGGLSRAKSDPAAKNCVSGCEGNYKGNTYNDWHTNKGITWCTFKDWASKKSIPESKWCDMFINMSDETWEDIFKERFWDKANLSKLKSQAIAEYWVNARWGNPTTAQKILRDALKKNGVDINSTNIDELIKGVNSFIKNGNNLKNEEKLFTDFVDLRIDWLNSLPAAKNNKGWFKRQEAFRERGLALIRIKKGVIEKARYMVLGVFNSNYRTFNSNIKSNDILIGLGILGVSIIVINYINNKTN